MNAQTKTQADTPETYGDAIEPRTVRLERLLPGPIERVWAYLRRASTLDRRAFWWC